MSGFQFLHTLVNACYGLSPFLLSPASSWDRVAPHRGSEGCLPADDVQHLVMCSLAMCVSSWGKCVFRSFAHFFLGYLPLLLRCQSALDVPDTSHLASLFSHSELSLHFLDDVLHSDIVFSFDGTQLRLCVRCPPETPLPHPKPRGFLPLFFSYEFYSVSSYF